MLLFPKNRAAGEFFARGARVGSSMGHIFRQHSEGEFPPVARVGRGAYLGKETLALFAARFGEKSRGDHAAAGGTLSAAIIPAGGMLRAADVAGAADA